MFHPLEKTQRSSGKTFSPANAAFTRSLPLMSPNFTTRIAAEVADFDPIAAFPSPKDARRTDRFAQFAVFAAHQALLDSGLDLNKVDHQQAGAFIGSGIGGLHTIEEQHKILLGKGPGRLSPFMIPMLILNMGSGLFSMYHDLQRAESRHLLRLRHLHERGWRGLAHHQNGRRQCHVRRRQRGGDCALGLGGFCAMRALSTRNDDPQHASRPFDIDRDGFVMGEGGGVLSWRNLNMPRREARAFTRKLSATETPPTRTI